MKKDFFNKIPILPISALIFYLGVLILWLLNIIPSPSEIVLFLENLYNSYGLVGLFIASFLEGIVYLGLYFPGSFIIALAVFLSNGSFFSLISISLVVALALTLTSLINYILGRYITPKIQKKNEILKKYKKTPKGLFYSMLHPNILAFYFFNSGIKKQNPWKIVLVPVGMIPYGLFLAYILFIFKTPLKQAIESPLIMITYLLIWFIIAFIISLNKN